MHHPKSLLLEDLTSPEIGTLIQSGWRRVILTSGSVEQQGPHMPIDVDSAVAREVALRAAKKLNKTLVAPVVPIGWSQHHMSFPGTLSVPKQLFTDYLVHIGNSLLHHGFQQLLITSFHGGNFQLSLDAAKHIKEKHPAADVRTAVDLDLFFKALKPVLKEFFPDRTAFDCHAACCITSMQCCIDESRVRTDKVEDGAILEALPEFSNLSQITKNGILGITAGYSKELGERLYDAVIDFLLRSWELEPDKDD